MDFLTISQNIFHKKSYPIFKTNNIIQTLNVYYYYSSFIPYSGNNSLIFLLPILS